MRLEEHGFGERADRHLAAFSGAQRDHHLVLLRGQPGLLHDRFGKVGETAQLRAHRGQRPVVGIFERRLGFGLGWQKPSFSGVGARLLDQ